MTFTSHISGKNATVEVYPDRVEWLWKGWMSTGAKAATALMTGGMSYLATGVRGQRGSESIPISAITHVASKTHRFQDYVVLSTSGGNVEMRVSKAEADALKKLLHELISGRHHTQQAPVVHPQVHHQPPVAPVPQDGPSLEQLAQWHAQGIISGEEFAAAKRKVLGL